jgi:hypothetical protein
MRGRARPSAFHRSLTAEEQRHGVAGPANTANTENRRQRRAAPARSLLAVAVALLAPAAIAAAAACLPDLAAIVTEDASLESGSVTHFTGCGDGIIATLDDGGDAGESCDPGAAAVQADADVPGCTAQCQLRCEGTIDPTSGHCYFVAGTSETYGNANTLCTLAKAHIVTFASNAEAELVNTQVAPDAPTYWVGLSQNAAFGSAYFANQPDEPGYAPPSGAACTGCFGIGDTGGIFASEVEAGTTPCLATSAPAGATSTARTWLQVACDRTDGGAVTRSRTTICEREPIGARAQDCIGGFCFTLARTAGSKRYLAVVAPTDPDTAQQVCSGLDGGSLVTFGSREEREQLAREIRFHYPVDPEEIYIGLVEDGGSWTWDDGVVADVDAASTRPSPWGNAQPSTSAAASGARAYMRLATSGAYDTQLAYADDGTKPARIYVCQRRAE